MNSSRGCLILMVLAPAILGLGVTACTQSTSRSPQTPGSFTTTTPERSPTASSSACSANAASSAEWLAVGDQITKARSTNKSLSSAIPPLLSSPVDIVNVGTYDLLAGPVSSSVNVKELGMTLPVDIESFFHIDGNPLSTVKLVQKNGGTYIDVPIAVSKVIRPYCGLTAWFQ
jgi:hypothetical protein